jgi:hypothetical protein
MADFINTIDVLGDDAVFDSIINGTVTEFKDDKIHSVGNNVFKSCTALKTVDAPNVTSIGNSGFYGCTSLAAVNLPKATRLNGEAFRGCKALAELNLPKATRLDANSLRGCSSLACADFPMVTRIDDYTFPGCTSLAALVLRSGTMAELVGANAFSCAGEPSPIANGTGYIYVPSALIEQYRTASGWSTYANQFRELEQWTLDGTVTGEIGHRVRFFNEDGTLLKSVVVRTGDDAVYDGDEPVKEGDWAFAGWSADVTNVTNDIDCYAQFKSTAFMSTRLVKRTITEYSSDKLTSVGNSAFYGCSSLVKVDLPNVTSIAANAFYSCTQLEAVILRSETMCTLANNNAFNTSKIKNGTGYIYVPKTLVDTYKTASGWSTYANQIRAIEDYPEICG